MKHWNQNPKFLNDIQLTSKNGISISNSNLNELYHNLISGYSHGLWLNYSYNNEIKANNISNSKYCVYFSYSSNNSIHNNTLLDSNIGISGINSWNNSDEDIFEDNEFTIDRVNGSHHIFVHPGIETPMNV